MLSVEFTPDEIKSLLDMLYQQEARLERSRSAWGDEDVDTERATLKALAKKLLDKAFGA